MVSCREYKNIHFVFSNFFFVENRVVYEIMCQKYGRTGLFVSGSPFAAVVCLCVYIDKDGDSWGSAASLWSWKSSLTVNM